MKVEVQSIPNKDEYFSAEERLNRERQQKKLETDFRFFVYMLIILTAIAIFFLGVIAAQGKAFIELEYKTEKVSQHPECSNSALTKEFRQRSYGCE